MAALIKTFMSYSHRPHLVNIRFNCASRRITMQVSDSPYFMCESESPEWGRARPWDLGYLCRLGWSWESWTPKLLWASLASGHRHTLLSCVWRNEFFLTWSSCNHFTITLRAVSLQENSSSQTQLDHPSLPPRTGLDHGILWGNKSNLIHRVVTYTQK